MPDCGKYIRGEWHCSNGKLGWMPKLNQHYIGEIAYNELSLRQAEVLNQLSA
jgi:hypothetical protein